MAVRLVVSGDRAKWPVDFGQRYAAAGIGLEWAPSVPALHALGMRVVTTASSGIPRSYFGDSIARLIHMPHSLASLHVIYPADAFDGCDTLFAAGPHHAEEFQALGKAHGLGERTVFPTGYGKFDVMRAEAPRVPIQAGRHVLIAPSWGDGNVISVCGLAMTERLVERGWRVTLRPHPSFFVNPDGQLEAILSRFADHPNVAVERSTGGSAALWGADVLISDYSGMALEFAALRRRPVLFVDGARKILNADWESLGVPAAEIDFRQRVGILVSTDCDAIASALDTLLQSGDLGQDSIDCFLYDEPDVAARVVALLRNEIAEVDT